MPKLLCLFLRLFLLSHQVARTLFEFGSLIFQFDTLLEESYSPLCL